MSDPTCPQCGVEPHQGTRFCSNCRFPLMLIAQKYRLIRQIGQGGSGLLFEAIHTGLARHPKRAIKFLRPEVRDVEGMEKRFRQEVEVTAELSRHNHHIVQIYDDFGEVSGLGFFYVMELLEGRTLRQLLRQQGSMPLYLVLHLMTQLLEAMAPVHEAGIVHRDLKPENLFLVEREGDPHYLKVIDFGLLKDTQPNTAQTQLTQGMMGTPAYMSPEQCLNHPIDIRSDIYSISAIFYELLSGQLPFPQIRQVASLVEVMQVHLMGTPIPLDLLLDIPPELTQLVMSGLRRDPNERVPSAREYLSRLRYLRPLLSSLEHEKLAESAKPADLATHYSGLSSQAEVMRLPKAHAPDEVIASQQSSESAVVETWQRKLHEDLDGQEASFVLSSSEPSIPSAISKYARTSGSPRRGLSSLLWGGGFLAALVAGWFVWNGNTSVLGEGPLEQALSVQDAGAAIPETTIHTKDRASSNVIGEAQPPEKQPSEGKEPRAKGIFDDVPLLSEKDLAKMWGELQQRRAARRALQATTLFALRGQLFSLSEDGLVRRLYDGIEGSEDARVALIYLQLALEVLRNKARGGQDIRSMCRAIWLRPLLLFRQRMQSASPSYQRIMRRYEQVIVTCQRGGAHP
ncbi:MAG: protein kinase [Myxococcales bacterium]|nr:protein kinase [Myxococcales bacterium]